MQNLINNKTGPNDRSIISNVQRNEQLRKRAADGEPKAQAIVVLADKLEETNLAALDRLAQLFGLATIQKIAEKSLTRYEEARREGASAYAVPAPTHTPDATYATLTTGSSNTNTTSDQGGTDVATKQGKPRTKGGVFFYLMKEHVTGLGINYEALHLPHVWPQRANNQGKPSPSPALNLDGSHQAQTQAHHANGQEQKQGQGQPEAPSTSPNTTSPRPPAATTNQPPQSQGNSDQPSQQPQHGQSGQPSRQEPGQKNQPSTTPPAAASTAPSATSAPAAGPGQTQAPAPVTAQAAANKPGRAKLTVIGPLFGTPRFKPEGQEGLLELLIKTEMSQSLPKGLPNLGGATISVWCTTKQFNKVKDTLTPASQLIIEGEPVPALDRNNRPVIRLVALRITTVKQAGRVAITQGLSI